MIKNTLFILLQYFIPQHLLSRLTGKIADCRIAFVKQFLINKFVDHYEVNLAEAQHTSAAGYVSFNDFFTRKLKPEARTIDTTTKGIISPADGAISASGAIKDGQILQAKGHNYSQEALLAGNKSYNFSHFTTIYLAPKDYHRVHMPVDGKLISMTYVPGELFSVNQNTANSIHNLFARNERLICYFKTPLGTMAIVLVGALIVAGIEASWMGRIAPAGKNIINWDYESEVNLKKGDELGCFYLGSTVIMLMPKGFETTELADDTVQMGQLLGTYS